MTTPSVDFYFDFASPTAYFAYHRLRRLEDEGVLSINYKPVLLGAIFKSTGNQSPAFLPPKA